MRPDVPAGPHRPGALPNLIVAGFSKSATSSLHQYLDRHPEIGMSRTKEIGYFCDQPSRERLAGMPSERDRALVWDRGSNGHLAGGAQGGCWRRGVDWYRTHFDPLRPFRGESTPAYALPWYAHVTTRMRSTVPDARIVLCVRDPVERALSRYRFNLIRGREHGRDVAAITHPQGFYVTVSRYCEAWERFERHFGADRIHIVETERLAGRPAATMDEIFAWLGLSGGLPDSEFEARWNETSALATPASRAIERARSIPGWGYLAERVPVRARHGWQRALGWGRSPRPVAEEDALRERFAELLAADAARFRRLTGRRFTQWSI